MCYAFQHGMPFRTNRPRYGRQGFPVRLAFPTSTGTFTLMRQKRRKIDLLCSALDSSFF